SLADERRAHDAGEAQREDALARLELRVAQGVAHDDGAPGLDDLLDDAVADGAVARGPLGERLALHVARRPDALARGRRSLGRRIALAPVGLAGEGVVVEQDEALLGPGDLDDGVEHRLEE